MLRAQAELLEQVGGGAGVSELVVDTDAAHQGGHFSLSRAHTASPRPPMTECSSQVMIFPHSWAAFSTMLLVQRLDGGHVE